MNRKWMLLAVISVAVTLLAVTCVTATSWSSTPLYTLRMEQASSQMNFLPAEMNAFTYTAEKGYTVNYDILALCDFTGLSGGVTCPKTCPYTCWETCPGICPDTMYQTCPVICSDTEGLTCPKTCPYTCALTCPGICPPYTS